MLGSARSDRNGLTEHTLGLIMPRMLAVGYGAGSCGTGMIAALKVRAVRSWALATAAAITGAAPAGAQLIAFRTIDSPQLVAERVGKETIRERFREATIRAATAARQLNDSALRAISSGVLARYESVLGESKAAEADFDRAEEAAREISNFRLRDLVTAQLVEDLLAAGKTEKAELVLTTITGPGSRLSTRTSLAVAAVEAGDHQTMRRQVERMASEIRGLQFDYDFRDVCDVARSAHGRGDVATAEWVFQELANAAAAIRDNEGYRDDEHERRCAALRQIAEVEQELGMTNRCWHTLRLAYRNGIAIKDRDRGEEVLENVLWDEFSSGDIAGGRRTLTHVRDGRRNQAGLSGLAGAYARLGDVKMALRTCRGIKDENERENALQGVVAGLAGAGKISAAEGVARELPEDFQRWDAFLRIVLTRSKASDFKGARSIAMKILDEDSRRNALRSVDDEESMVATESPEATASRHAQPVCGTCYWTAEDSIAKQMEQGDFRGLSKKPTAWTSPLLWASSLRDAAELVITRSADKIPMPLQVTIEGPVAKVMLALGEAEGWLTLYQVRNGPSYLAGRWATSWSSVLGELMRLKMDK